MTIWQRMADAVRTATRTDSFATALDRLADPETLPRPDPHTDIRFTIALIALCAKMARSDGAVTDDEIRAFKRIVMVPPDEEANVRRLFDLARRDVAGFEDYARQIGAQLAGERQLLRDVLEALMVIAAADGVLHEREDRFLAIAAEHLGVPASEVAHVRSLFVHEQPSPYAILGLQPSASDAEVRARHRQLAVEHHPDRLIGRGVGPDLVAVAERKLAAINAAFDQIAKERGL